MIKRYTDSRQRRKKRIRTKISGTALVPRASVFRSDRFIYVQIIDDEARLTLLSGNDRSVKSDENKTKRAHTIGKLLAEEALKKNIKKIVFDRSGYAYHGRVKAIAEGLREGGLEF